MSEIVYRDALLAEIPDIHSLIVNSARQLCLPHYDEKEALVFETFYKQRGVENLLQMFRSSIATIVATHQSQLVGVSQLQQRIEDGYLSLLYVHPDYAKRGIGSKMLKLIEYCARHHMMGVLDVESTKTAVPFYKRHGYTDLGKIADGRSAHNLSKTL